MLFALPAIDTDGTPVLDLWDVLKYYRNLHKYIGHYVKKGEDGDIRSSGWIDQEEMEMKIQFTRQHLSLTGSHEDWIAVFERWCDAKILTLQSDHLHVPDRSRAQEKFRAFLEQRGVYLSECPTMQNS